MVKIEWPDEVEEVAAKVIWSGGAIRDALTAALAKMQEMGLARKAIAYVEKDGGWDANTEFTGTLENPFPVLIIKIGEK